jgi:hypothetical protein
MTADGNNEIFQSYTDHIMEAGDKYLHNSVSDIIARLKMLSSFTKYYPNMRIPGKICGLQALLINAKR